VEVEGDEKETKKRPKLAKYLVGLEGTRPVTAARLISFSEEVEPN
jgi:hypothetical protein